MHVTGPASPLPPRNKDQSADAAKNHYLIFLNHCLEGVRGNVPKFEKLWQIRFQSNHFGWNNFSVILRLKIDKNQGAKVQISEVRIRNYTGSVSY